MLSWRYPPIGVSIHPLHGNPALQGLLYSLTVTDHGGKFFPPNPLIEIVPQNRQGFFVSGSVQGIPFSFSPARVSPTTYRPHLLTFMWWKHYHTNKERQEYPTSELVSCLFVLFSFSRFRPCPCLFVLTLEPLHRLSENISHAATFCYGCPSQVLILLQCQPKTDILVAFCWWPSPPCTFRGFPPVSLPMSDQHHKKELPPYRRKSLVQPVRKKFSISLNTFSTAGI